MIGFRYILKANEKKIIAYNIHGQKVERTPLEYPYSYDPFCVFKAPSWSDNDKVVYSDRLWSWNSKKYDHCCEKVWGNQGQLFGGRQPDEIEKFLRLYFDDPELMLTGIEEGCNCSNGYPFWVFYLNSKKVYPE